MQIFDVTRTVSPTIAVWPGDPPFDRGWGSTLAAGDPANVGWMASGLHVGTHADAPYHFLADGMTIDQIPLDVFVGTTRVLDVGRVHALTSDLLPAQPLPARILFKTHQSLRADDEWDSNFPPVDPDLVEALSAEGVLLLGTDAPSVDPYESKTLTSHHALARQGIHILENLRLQGVPEGEYLLVAAPLKLEGMDGAPVRALLIAD